MKKSMLISLCIVGTIGISLSARADIMPRVNVNGQNIETQAITVNGRTMIPVRGVFEELGYTVNWADATKTATIFNGINEIIIQEGQSDFKCNGKTITPDVPQQNINARFYIPLRSVAESIAAEVAWNEETNTASINTNKDVEQSQIVGIDKTLIGTNPKNNKPIYLVGGCGDFGDAPEYSNGILVNGKRIWFDMSYKEAEAAIGTAPTNGDNKTWGTFKNTSIGTVQVGEADGEVNVIVLFGSDDFDVQYGKYLYTYMDGEKAAKDNLGDGEISFNREPELVIKDHNIRDSRGYTYIPIRIVPNGKSPILDISKEIIEFN